MKRRSVLRPIAIVIVISLALITGLIISWIWNDVQDNNFNSLASAAAILNSYDQQVLVQQELALKSVGLRMLDISGQNMDERRLEVGRQALQVYPDLLAFGLTRLDGSMITFTGNVSTTGVPNLKQSNLTRRSFERALRGTRISVGEPYFFEQVNDWILPIRVPIFEGDSLVALNTSAIRYQSILDSYRELGLDSRFQIHIINSSFNTTQVYFPLQKVLYDSLLRRESEIYSNYQVVEASDEFARFEAFNEFEGFEIIGVRLNRHAFERLIIVSMKKSLLYEQLWLRSRFVILAYLLLTAVTLVVFVYLGKKERAHSTALESQKANLESLFESTNSIIGLFDNKKRLMEYNKAFADYAMMTDGIKLEVGMVVMDHMKDREIANLFHKFQSRALNGEKFTETVKYPVADSFVYFQLSYNPIYQSGVVQGISMFVNDVSELKNSQAELETYSKKLEQLVLERTQELNSANEELKSVNRGLTKALKDLKDTQTQLIQSEKMASLGVLAAGVGHEINNPLNFIKGGLLALISTLEKSDTKTEEVTTYLNVIEEGVRRCSIITEGLSNYSRSGGKMDEKCDLISVIDNCLVILESKLKGKVKIQKAYEKCDPILGNEGKLHQLFLNIISNAEQAIPDTGTIAISCKMLDESVEVTIEDDGVGIKKRDINKISDPFFTTKAPGEGTGLGLSIAYSIVEEHKGTIQCFSKLKEGTRFVINLPTGES